MPDYRALAYADVILRRFEAHTGVVPTIDGVPVSFAGVGT